MKQGETGMSFRHAPGKLLVIGRFLEKIVSALLPFLTMLVSARFIDLVLNQRMEEAIRDACLLGALILCQRLGGNLVPGCGFTSGKCSFRIWTSG